MKFKTRLLEEGAGTSYGDVYRKHLDAFVEEVLQLTVQMGRPYVSSYKFSSSAYENGLVTEEKYKYTSDGTVPVFMDSCYRGKKHFTVIVGKERYDGIKRNFMYKEATPKAIAQFILGFFD